MWHDVGTNDYPAKIQIRSLNYQGNPKLGHVGFRSEWMCFSIHCSNYTVQWFAHYNCSVLYLIITHTVTWDYIWISTSTPEKNSRVHRRGAVGEGGGRYTYEPPPNWVSGRSDIFHKMPDTRLKKSQSSSDDPETMFGKILDRLGAIDNKLENLGDKVSRIEQSFKEYTQKFHNLEGDVRQIEHSLNTYTDKTDKLQAIADKLAKSTPEALNKLLDIEHLDATKKLEVQGIPHDSSEQPMLILNKLSNILQANISDRKSVV